MMRLPILLWSILVAATATDTVWWHTDGGSVRQHNYGDIENCTLTVENPQGEFAFVWNRDLPASILVTRQDWRFPPEQSTPVALRIGDVWLGNGDGAPNLTAMTAQSTLMVIPNQPVDRLLTPANEVVIKTPETQFGIELSRGKMTALMTALHKCREVIGSLSHGGAS